MLLKYFSKAELIICQKIRMTGYHAQLWQGKFWLDTRKNFFTEKVIRYWHGLPKEVLESLSQGMLKERLEVELSALVSLTWGV